MALTPTLAELPKKQIYGVLVLSLLRTFLGVLVILYALSLVPENADVSLIRPLVIIILGVAIYGYLFRRQIRKIEHARYPAISVVEALILTATMFLAFFAGIYVMMSAADPGAFTEGLDHFNAFYFALTVLATVGFGDITPVTAGARFACMIQMAIDIVFIAIMVRALTSAAQKSLSFKKAQAEGEKDPLIADV
ncbi:MAG: potassium channel family protein [Candidatus Nanopelagicales bacterium]